MRKFALILGLVAGVVASAPNVQAATISVSYNVVGSIYSTGLGGALAGSFTGLQDILYDGSGLSTLSHGPIVLVNGSQSIFTNILLPGAFNLTGANTSNASGPGNLFSNGVVTMMTTKVNTGGFVHCYDLTPSGCAIFVMFPASLMLPQTGGISNQALAGNLGLGQPPATFAVAGPNFGGNATTSSWTFSEIPGSRYIVPEPATGTLVGLGMLGLAMAGGSLKRRRN